MTLDLGEGVRGLRDPVAPGSDGAAPNKCFIRDGLCRGTSLMRKSPPHLGASSCVAKRSRLARVAKWLRREALTAIIGQGFDSGWGGLLFGARFAPFDVETTTFLTASSLRTSKEELRKLLVRTSKVEERKLERATSEATESAFSYE